MITCILRTQCFFKHKETEPKVQRRVARVAVLLPIMQCKVKDLSTPKLNNIFVDLIKLQQSMVAFYNFSDEGEFHSSVK